MLLISESYCESGSLGKKHLWRSRPDQRHSEKVMFAGRRDLGIKAAAACWVSFTSFGRGWAEVGVAGSQDRWSVLGQAASSRPALAQALHAPALHSPAAGHGALRGKHNLGSHCTPPEPLKPKGSLQASCMRLSEQERSRSGMLLFTSPYQDQLCKDTCVFWLFKDSAENLLPCLGIETETEHFRNVFLIVCVDFFWSLRLWAQPCCLNTDKTPIGTIIMVVSGKNHCEFRRKSNEVF